MGVRKTNGAIGVMREDPEFLSRQIITYIGNKRQLLGFIGKAVDKVISRTGREKLSMFDAFSGSGIVSRYFKRYASRLYANDLEEYSRVCNRCYLSNRGEVDMERLRDVFAGLDRRIRENPREGFVTELYAPRDDKDIRPGERAFYTRRNAMFIDTARQEMETLPEDIRSFFVAPLISSASVHTNTAGVFKGFYKNSLGVGQFGGSARNALARITGDIELELPVFSRFDCEVSVTRKDALVAAMELPEEVDVAYLDPPYNQHPYGSNYFMLNLIADYRRPERISEVSGIPGDWNHSDYNRRTGAREALFHLVDALRARYVIISYNSDGFIDRGEFTDFLSTRGRLDVMDTSYNTFRGGRNLRSRDIHVKEYLFLLEKN
ncbi:MAG: DNA adenine methylase [Victivallaceae bacterium]|nr:DNA adenine methylase [Victivallaceae bacterium]